MAESIGSSAAETGDIDRLIEDAWSVATSDPQRARTLTELALDRSQKANYERGRAYCMRNTAYVHLMSSDLELALPLAESALAQLHALDETPGVASALDIKTLIYWRLGSYDQALQYAYETLDFCQHNGDTLGQAWAQHNLGAIYTETGDSHEAIGHLELSAALFRKAAYRTGELKVLSALGEAYFAAKEYPSALEYYQQRIDGKDEVDVPQGYLFERHAFHSQDDPSSPRPASAHPALWSALFFEQAILTQKRFRYFS